MIRSSIFITFIMLVIMLVIIIIILIILSKKYIVAFPLKGANYILFW